MRFITKFACHGETGSLPQGGDRFLYILDAKIESSRWF